MGTDDSAAASLGGVTEVQVDEAVIENGSDLAFAMGEGGKPTLWIGRVEIMSGRKKIPLTTAIFLEDAKLTMCILSALGLRSARTECSFLGRFEISLEIPQRAA
jgi:hypothetical protein